MADLKNYWKYAEGKSSNIIQKFGRIKYVEPNDVYGYGKNQNGEKVAPLLPDYEDLCIAFNLIIETYDRLEPQKRNEIGLMWTDKLYTEKNSGQKEPYVSVDTLPANGLCVSVVGNLNLSRIHVYQSMMRQRMFRERLLWLKTTVDNILVVINAPIVHICKIKHFSALCHNDRPYP